MPSRATILVLAQLLMFSNTNGDILNTGRGIDPSKFTFASVRVEVRNIAGQLVPDGYLFCVGHDLGLIYPTLRGGRPLTNGTAAIHLPRGEYTFIAYGNNFFISERREVAQNSTIGLRTDTTTGISILDRNGMPIAGCFVGAVDSRLKPLMPYFGCGETGPQPFGLQVNRGSVADFIVHKGFPTPSVYGTASLFHFPDVPAGQQIVFRVDPLKLARLNVKVSAASGRACPGANLSFQLPSLSVEWTSPYIHRDSKAPWQALDLWTTPGRVLVGANSEPAAGWRFGFRPELLDLRAGSNYVVRFGGRLEPKIWFQAESTWVAPGAPGAQVWVDLADSFGGGINSAEWPKALKTGVLSLKNLGGRVVDEVQLSPTGQGRVSNYTGLHYSIALNLGVFGTHSLTGKCDHPTNLFQTTATESRHFRLEVPSWSEAILPKFATNAEAAYDALAQVLQCQLTGKVHFHTLLKGGFASGLHIFDSAAWFKDPRILEYPGVWYFDSFLHEFGHVFQGASQGLPAQFYGPNAGHGEAFVGALEPFVKERTVGKVYTYFGDIGVRSRFFYRLYQHAGYGGELEDPLDWQGPYWQYFFVLCYLRDALGPGVFAEFAQLWGNQTRQDGLKRVCREGGLNDDETLCAFYSVAARQNLAWLFSLAGFQSSAAKVQSVVNQQLGSRPAMSPPRP